MDEETRRRLEALERGMGDASSGFDYHEARLEALERVLLQLAADVCVDNRREPGDYAHQLFVVTTSSLPPTSRDPRVRRVRDELRRITDKLAGARPL